MKQFEMIPMAEEHIAALTELEKICFGGLAWNETGLRDELTNDTAHFLVAKSGGEIAGYIGVFVVMESCYVSNVAVFPQFRRMGCASELIEAACALARELAAESISLEVRPSNTAAIALYSSLGFEEIGLRKNFYRAPKEDALIMTREL